MISKWQTIKHNKDGQPYIRIRNQRYYMEDFARRQVRHNGELFHGVSWCGYYYLQFNRDCDEARYIFVA